MTKKQDYLSYFLGMLNEEQKCKVYAHVDSVKEKRFHLMYFGNNNVKQNLGFLRIHSYGISLYRLRNFLYPDDGYKAYRMETESDMKKQMEYLIQNIEYIKYKKEKD